MYRNILLLFIALLLPGLVSATHIVGGVMNYQCLGNNSYKVTLRVYRDCFNGQAPFDNPAPIALYGESQNLIATYSATNPVITQVPPTISNPCFVPPNSVCVEEAVYTFNITTPNNTDGYYIVYQRCCRNNTILNLQNPGNEGATYSAYIPPQATASCNSNPVFNNFPPIFLCVNAPFTFDHSATDADGDSLAYELCHPPSGGTPLNPAPSPPDAPPFPPVNFSNPFSSGYPITSSPAIALNSQTGLLGFTPTQIGQFVVGICVKEYRNGVLISSTLRDFQFNVINCPGIVVASFPGQQTFCDGLQVNFINNSFNATSYHWDFGVPGITTDVSSAPTPSYTYPTPGQYTVTLIANPNTVCADTATSTFFVKPPLNAEIIIPNSQCASGNNYSFQAGGNYSNAATFSWTFGNGSPSSSSLENPSGIAFPGAGTYQVSLTVTDSNCNETVVEQVNVIANPMSVIEEQKDFCIGRTVSFNNLSLYSTSYFWDFGDPNTTNDTSSVFNPTYTYNDTGVYTVMLVADNGLCFDTSFVEFEVMPVLKCEILSSDSEMCSTEQWFNFYASGLYDSTAIKHWTFSPGSNVIFSTQDSVTGVQFSTPGTYSVHLTLSDYGCASNDSIEVSVVPPPKAIFDEPGPDCAPNTIIFGNNSESVYPLNVFWDFGDGTSSTVYSPVHVYSEPGVYNVILTVWSDQGCTDTSRMEISNAVTVYPSPEAGFHTVPESASIFDPLITAVDESKGASHISYMWGDVVSGSFPDKHYYQNTGKFVVMQVVSNEFGCRDTANSIVTITPGFIPNAFTPNKDGNNDVFLPVLLNVQAYKLSIWDRWGELIYESKAYEKGWDGTFKGHPAKQDMYIYQIEAGSSNGKTYKFTGHVFLLP